ncbi:MAG: glycosyltransferase family 2 protein [Lachnospirales bacterium]
MVKVSVIVPIYRVEKYLRYCIESLLEQTLKDIEIILVDDGSPDGCPDICDKFEKQDDRIKVIHKNNGGVSAARNDGLAVAKGEWVIFCDSDDWMESAALESLYNKAYDTGSDVVIGDVYQVRDDKKLYTTFYANEFITEDCEFINRLIEADIYRTYCPNPPATGPAFGYGGPWNKLVRRSLLIDNHIKFDLRLKGIFDDILYTAHIFAAARKVTYISVPVYNYRITSSSITHSFKSNVLEINDAIFNSWQEFFEEQKERADFSIPFYACVMRRLEESISLYFLNKNNEKTKKTLKDELKKISNSDPYKTAFKKVELDKLSKKQKLLAVLGRKKMLALIFLIPWM